MSLGGFVCSGPHFNHTVLPWLGLLIKSVEDPGCIQDVLVPQLRCLLQGSWSAGALGVAYFLVPGYEVGVGTVLGQDVQVGEVAL